MYPLLLLSIVSLLGTSSLGGGVVNYEGGASSQFEPVSPDEQLQDESSKNVLLL